jgi:acyl carrier protein
MNTEGTSPEVVTGTAGADLVESVTRAVALVADQDPRHVLPQTRFFEDLALDSTGVLELLIELEGSLGVEFDAETLEPSDFETVESLVAYVTKQVGEGS